MTDSPVAVVTGAARGIGLAIARLFLERGYRGALLDIDAETLTRTETGLNATERVLAVVCDIAMPDQVAASFERIVARFGRIDSLLNNAVIAVFKPELGTRFDSWSL